jgi:hypothetical protein
LSVEAVQVRLTWLEVIDTGCKFVGAVGDVVSPTVNVYVVMCELPEVPAMVMV